MGRRLRGAALRAHKRSKAAHDEILDSTAKQAETKEIAEQTNEEFFVLDTTGDTTTKAVVQNNGNDDTTNRNKNKRSSSISSLPLWDRKRMDELIEKHGKEKLEAMVKAGEIRLTGNRSVVTKSQKKTFDLWGHEEDEQEKKEDPKRNKNDTRRGPVAGIKVDHVHVVAKPISKRPIDAVAVDVAKGGQSYRPDPNHYEKIVQDAVTLEVRRNTAENEKKAPLAKGMSAETRALLVGDTSSEEEDDEDSEDDEQGQTTSSSAGIRKRPEKLTRAERNRQKRIRAEKATQNKEKRNKRLMNSVAELPKYKKEMKKQEKELQEKKAKIEEGKRKKRGIPGKDYFQRFSEQDPLHAPTFPVALESEHKDASLRTIKPKGSLVTDRMASFVDRNLVSKRKMGDKKRVIQGKRRKLNVKGKGYEIARDMDYNLMG